MRQIEFVILTVVCMVSGSIMNAQSKVTSYEMKKGEVLDILVLSTKPDTKQLFDLYKKTAFPVAFKMSYKSLPGFKIDENLEGNYHPDGFALGKWNDIEKRERFLLDINKEVPDFHEQRRSIFSYFGLTYYEMSKDLSFKIDRTKFNVVTAYWHKNKASFSSYKKEWLQKLKNEGGKTIVELEGGKSPYGYNYNPDYLVITQWQNREAFETFKSKSLVINYDDLTHINQFVIK